MRLNINKACDLSAISVLPPHTRGLSAMNSGVDVSGLGRNQASQLRSQSQQSFSQGVSLSQISQNSFEDNLGKDPNFDSQEREKSSKRLSALAPLTTTRDDSQIQLSRTSNNVMRRWGTTMASDNRCQVSEELEIRLRFLESSLNKLGMILDALQSDVMHLNRAVKEVSLDVESIRQKTNILDNSMQQVLKEEESIKACLDGRLKSISDQMMKEVDRDKINEIATTIPTLPKQIEAQLHGFQRDIYVIIRKSIEVLTNNMKFAINNFSEAISSREAKSCIPIRRQQNSQKSDCHLYTIRPTFSSLDHTRKVAVLKKEENAINVLKPQMNNSSKSIAVKHSLVPLVQQEQIIIESDNEDDGSLCCIPVKKEKGALSKESQLDKEAEEETLRILQKARKRKRRQSNYVYFM